jgi:hypothetical protein
MSEMPFLLSFFRVMIKFEPIITFQNDNFYWGVSKTEDWFNELTLRGKYFYYLTNSVLEIHSLYIFYVF